MGSIPVKTYYIGCYTFNELLIQFNSVQRMVEGIGLRDFIQTIHSNGQRQIKVSTPNVVLVFSFVLTSTGTWRYAIRDEDKIDYLEVTNVIKKELKNSQKIKL